MLERLFGSKKGAQRGEDAVWITDAARSAGFAKEVAAQKANSRSVVAVALTPAALDRLESLLAASAPIRCADVFGKDALRAALAQQGSVAVALASALPAEANPSAAEVLVFGRSESCAADDAIVAFADLLGRDARIVFHLALEDRLLQAFGSSTIRPLLEKLGVQADEPLCHPMVTRAIRNAQEKLSNV